MEAIEWSFIVLSGVAGGLVGWLYGRLQTHKTVIRSLLWIIQRRIQMGIFFNPMERAMLRQAVKLVQ